MSTDILQIDQLLTVGGFLAALVAVLMLVQANRSKISGRIAKGRRMQLAEVTALGPDARAMLLSVDGTEFLVVTTKRQAPVITELPAQTKTPVIATVAA
ncbi:Flagellar biosynthesis protein, FliO [Thalassovita gelatinovora]|uniref:Flagellar biosynthesis protein, FliO n=1 Tax=Thalassovita gelatinovora TaxID=53501 RepID=A0A0N7LW96_THAGE|nr:flagellar biosynthetic protein FliO [Thalassovita gelatinovora]QIZ82401.1 flagellar assembly protein FliO [Thalassovita gelatinovora]CUH68482.1 Flagellar biosynthesis protein, FliO [Thalassovita gelatinovora]SEQ53184.1 flagellar protein FliO/FliZ [Thalassovita gelatinovora]